MTTKQFTNQKLSMLELMSNELIKRNNKSKQNKYDSLINQKVKKVIYTNGVKYEY